MGGGEHSAARELHTNRAIDQHESINTRRSLIMSKSSTTPLRNAFAPLLLGALALGLAASAFAQDQPPLRLTAFAVNMGANRPAATASTVVIQIDRWSTDPERQSLIDTLNTKGADRLLGALQKTPRVGSIRTPDSVAWDLHYARETAEPDGGRRIVLATDRRMSFWEMANRERSVDYPFSVIEIHLDKDGKGDGRMSIATRVTASADGHIELENYSAQPVLLQNVQIDKRK